MADYYPLLARALDALPDRTPAMRNAVYARARAALIGQLRSLDPPLSEADINLESGALDSAIARLELDHSDPKPSEASAPAVIPAPPPASAPSPSAPLPLPPKPLPPKPAPVPAMPPAPPPDLGARQAFPPPVEPVAPVVQIQPRKAKPPTSASPVFEPELVAADGSPPVEADASALPLNAAEARQRPRIDVVAPSGGRSRLARNIFVGGVLLVVIGLIAVAAFLLRDRPADLQPNAAETSGAPVEGAESKFSDRVGGEGQPAERPASAVPATESAQTGAQTPIPQQPDVSVAQRAVLFEENTAAPESPPIRKAGRVVWRLDAVNGEQGQPLETVVRATVDFPDAGLSLALTMRRNLDSTLPASHVIELAFTNTGPEGAKRAVQDVGLLQVKDEESSRGSPISGLPVRVKENLFLIGLSSLRNDVERNTDLMLHKNWFDLAIKFTAGPRGILTFEKGNSGAQVLQSAFDQWK